MNTETGKPEWVETSRATRFAPKKKSAESAKIKRFYTQLNAAKRNMYDGFGNINPDAVQDAKYWQRLLIDAGEDVSPVVPGESNTEDGQFDQFRRK
jgi:hypothetical protein